MPATSGKAYYEQRHRAATDATWRAPESYRPFVQTLTDRGVAGRLLDVGCGDGWASYWAECAGFDVLPIDIAGAALERAFEKLTESTGVVAEASQLPCRSGSFDCVLALGSLEHSTNVDRALAEVARVLRPGGTAIIVVPNSEVLHGLWHGTEQASAVSEDRRSVGESEAALAAAGLEVDTVEKELERFHFRASQPAVSRAWTAVARAMLASVPLRWTYQFLFVCRKPDCASGAT